MTDQNAKLPITFWIISGVGLVWNLIGVMNFFGQTFMSDETMASLPQEQQDLFQAVPSWMTIVFAIAVFSGTLASVGLLIKKAWAVPAFLTSLLFIAVQVSYNLFAVDIGAILGTSAIFVTLSILIVGAFLYYYSKLSEKKGWLS